MQISALKVRKLFNSVDHPIEFETRPDDGEDAEATVTIIHGPNGVGKTTLLNMLEGMMSLDFTIFRNVPFESASLHFTTGDTLEVKRDGGPLCVAFQGHEAMLHPGHPGAFDDENQEDVDKFRSLFNEATQGLSFELVEAGRQPNEIPWWRQIDDPELPPEEIEIAAGQPDRVRRFRRKRQNQPNPLARRIERFIADAQVDSRRFFSTNEPELFPRVMERLTGADSATYDATDLRQRLTTLKSVQEKHEQLGLEVEPWSFDELVGHLDHIQDLPNEEHALTVLGTYAEFLETAAEKRQLLALRLETFVGILGDFYLGKRIRVDAIRGLVIETIDDERLTEHQLSSGEYHLLYLMVTALVSQRRGAVIAIDEPEMSMHIEWQRKLIRNLVSCASHASPQLLFTTHSPEVVADFRNRLVSING